VLIRYSLLYAYPHKQPQLRGFASIEDQLALKKFGYSENVDRNCEHDKDYYLEYELDGADNDENEEESFTITNTSRRVEQCFQWHDDVACRRGCRAMRCRIDNWTEKCVYCERDEKVDKMTGECVRNGMLLGEA